MWHVYLIQSNHSHRTYIGCTTDPDRRVRQHNRELAGGAKSTFHDYGHWVLVALLSGFKNRSEAYRWEKIIKSRCWGFHQRIGGFKAVAQGICPTSNKLQKHYDPPTDLKLETKY